MSLGANKQALMGAAGSGGAADDFYTHQIANSCRFGVVNSYLTRAISGVTDNTQNTISFWVKRSKISGAPASSRQPVMGNSGGAGQLEFLDADTFRYASYGTLESNVQLFRDTSAWYHFYIYRSTSNGGGAIYVNGVQVSLTTNTAGSAGIFQNGQSLQIGASNNGSVVFDGYIADVYGIYDQNIAHTEFGEFKNGVWIPKDAASAITFGSHDFHLKFESSGDLGNDSSGNNNDFTVTNVSTHDQMKDSPTFGSSSTGNCCTLSPLTNQSGLTITENNLKMSRSSAGNVAIPATMGASTGKHYFEVYWNNDTQVGNYVWGFVEPDSSIFGSNAAIEVPATYSLRNNSGNTYLNGSIVTMNGTDPTTGTIIGVAIDFDNGKIFYGQDGGSGSRAMNWNNSSTGTGVPQSGTNPAQTFTAGSITLIPAFSISSIGDTNWILNFGQSSAFSGALTSQGNTDGNGQGDFYYSPPTGFTGWTTGGLTISDEINPAETDDNFPQKLFGILKYTGNGSQRTISTAFQFDWLWSRSSVQGQNWYNFDTNRGIFGSNNYYLKIDADDAEADLPQDNYISQTASGSDAGGYVLSNGSWFNSGSHTQINWFWRANGGSTSSDASGDITSVGQKDPSGCFSIVTYTGSGTQAQTIAHHLDQAPIAFIAKKRNGANNWMFTAGTSYMNDRYAYLDSLGAAQGGLYGGGRSFSANAGSSLMALEAAGEMNGSGSTYVGYFFSNCEGYIKIGEYDGNGTTGDGTFVYTGFRPAMVITKMLDGGAEWSVYDDVRDTYNVSEHLLQLDLSDAERTDLDEIDILSNGFKCQSNGGRTNQSSKKYIFLAFAKNPFKYSVAR